MSIPDSRAETRRPPRRTGACSRARSGLARLGEIAAALVVATACGATDEDGEPMGAFSGSELWTASLQTRHDGSPTVNLDPLRWVPSTRFELEGPPYELHLYMHPSGLEPADPSQRETRDALCKLRFDDAGALVPGELCSFAKLDQTLYRASLDEGALSMSGDEVEVDVLGALASVHPSDPGTFATGTFTLKLIGVRSEAPFDHSQVSDELFPKLPPACAPSGCWAGAVAGSTTGATAESSVGLDRYQDPSLVWSVSSDALWHSFRWFVRSGDRLTPTDVMAPAIVLSDECRMVARAGNWMKDEYDLSWVFDGDSATLTIDQADLLSGPSRPIFRVFTGQLERVPCP